MPRQIKKSVEVKFKLYKSYWELMSDGDLTREKFLYLVYGSNYFGISVNQGEETFARAIEYEAKEIRKRFPNARISVYFPDTNYRLNHFIDGYFGRPVIHAGTSILRPIDKKRQSQIKSLLSKLNQRELQLVIAN